MLKIALWGLSVLGILLLVLAVWAYWYYRPTFELSSWRVQN